MEIPVEGTFRFVISDQDPDATIASLRKRLQKALNEAVKSTKVSAMAELDGGFLGLGETAVILGIWHAAKAGGAAFALGAAGAAGKAFYTNYLAPELIKRNLLPSKFQEIIQEPKSSKKTPVVKKTSEAKKTSVTKKMVVAKKASVAKNKKKVRQVRTWS